MRRRNIFVVTTSLIIVTIIYVAMSTVVEYSWDIWICLSFAYFAGCVLATMSIYDVLFEKKKSKLYFYLAGTGICLVATVLLLMLTMDSALSENCKNVTYVLFVIALIGFIFFNLKLMKLENKDKNQ